MKSSIIKKGLKCLGLTDSDLKKPFIAVVNNYSEIVPGHMHLHQFAEHMKQDIRPSSPGDW